jgi:hypothetical protein
LGAGDQWLRLGTALGVGRGLFDWDCGVLKSELLIVIIGGAEMEMAGALEMLMLGIEDGPESGKLMVGTVGEDVCECIVGVASGKLIVGMIGADD